MPPKQRGHNTAGRDKIFRKAIEHVHVGIGYSVLGNFSLQLIAGGAHESAALENSAFYLELNELLLSNTSSDFKKFRFEILPLCETRALVIHHQKSIAHKLLLALGNKENNEAFFGFLKLSIAFVRDMQERFLVYFEAFHQVVNLGIYDGKGQLIPEIERVQLVFATQAAWLRELGAVLVKDEFRRQVRGSVIPACVRLMNDSKEYVRRLAAEVLASCCRQQRQLIPLAFEVASSLTGRGSPKPLVDDAEDSAEPIDNTEEDDDIKSDADDDVEPNPTSSFDESDPVVDGMVTFVGELLRGLRGSLHTNFEDMFSMVVVAMRLVHVEGIPALPNKEIVSAVQPLWIHEHDEETDDAAHRYSDTLTRVGAIAIPPVFRALAAETRKSAGSAVFAEDATSHPVHRLLNAAVNLLQVSASNPTSVDKSLPAILFQALQQTLCSAHHAALQELAPLELPLAKLNRLLLSKGATLETLMGTNSMIGPLLMVLQPLSLTSSVEGGNTKEWLRNNFAIALAQQVTRMIAKCSGSVEDSIADTVFTFSQDILQKNRAACLATERNHASTTGDENSDSDDYDSGEEATPLPKKNLQTAIEFAFDDYIDDAVGIPLLAAILQWFTGLASTETTGDQPWTHTAMLLLLLAAERTSHANSSPLQRILEHSSTLRDVVVALLSKNLSSIAKSGSHSDASSTSSTLHMILALLPHVLQSKDASRVEECVKIIDINIVARCSSSPTMLPIAAHATQVLTALAAKAMDGAITSAKASTASKKKKSVGLVSETASADATVVVAGAKKCIEQIVLQTASMIGSKTSAELAANQTLTTTIRYILGALRSLVGRVKHTPTATTPSSFFFNTAARGASNDGAQRNSILLSTRVGQVLSSTAQEALLMVLIKSLSSPSQPVRIQALEILKSLCYEDGSQSSAAATRVKGFTSVPAAFFDSLIGAETADPLANAGNIDAAKIHLTTVSYEASVGHIHNPLQAKILLHSCFGLLHIKFAVVWPIALKMITDLLRFEATTGTPAEQRASATPIWNAVRDEARDIVFSAGGPTFTAKSKNDDATKLDSSATTYTLQFSDQQHHEEGSLVSKVFAGATYQDHDHLGLMRFLKDRQRCDVSTVVVALSSSPLSTDSFTVAKTFIGALEEILKHSASPFDPKVMLVEDLLVELHSVSDGTHASVTDIKGLDDRLHLVLRALLAAPTTIISDSAAKHNSAWRHATPEQQQGLAPRNQRLISICTSFLPSTNFVLQRDAVENLKRLKVSPFEPHAAKIIPFCGTNMKEAFTFLQTLHVEDDINVEQRIEYIAAVLVVVLPKLSQKVAKEKLKDQAVLSRRVMGMLNSTGLEAQGGVSQILTRAMEQILPPTTSASTSLWAAYDFISDLKGTHLGVTQEGKRSGSHYIRRFEQRVKQITTATRVLDQFISAVGSKFKDWAARCFVILVEAYLFSSRSMHPADIAFPSSAIGAASALRKVVTQAILSLVDQFPNQVIETVAPVKETRMRLFVKELQSNSKTLASFTTVATTRNAAGGTGIHSSFLKLIVVWVQHPVLHSLVAFYGAEVLQQLNAALEASTPGSDCVHRASSDTVFAALRFITEALQSADEALEGYDSEESTLGTLFVDVHMISLFEALYRLVVHSSSSESQQVESDAKNDKSAPRGKPTGRRVMGFTVRMWGEVIQTVAYLSERIGRGETGKKHNNMHNSKKLHEMLGQMLEVALKFVSNPLCCVDNDTVITAASVVETLVSRVAVIHPAQHYRRLVMLFNMVTNPQARQSLCRSYMLMAKKYAPAAANTTAALQFEAVGRVLFALNSFAAAPDNEEEEEQQQPVAKKESEKKSKKRAVEGEHDEDEDEEAEEEVAKAGDAYDRYDFERRYHCFHSLMTFFNHNGNYGALQRRTPSTKASAGTTSAALPTSTVRQERLYEGEDDVTIPLDKAHQAVLVSDAVMAVATNVMFFLRDHERTIRALAAQSVFSLLQYISGVADETFRATCLSAIVRPIILSSLRQGIVAKDPSIRLAHMESFGGLAKHFPAQFPSFAALYSPNSERNFFSNVGHAQHKCRLNAFAMLRKQSAALNVRDQIRVFVPFLLVLLKDYAQGKRSDSNAAANGSLSEGRAKGYAESAIITLASLVRNMPWEGYYHVLKLLLQAATENESLRLTMLRGVVQVLQNFHFLDEMHDERSDIAPSHQKDLASSSDDDENEADVKKPKKSKTNWKRGKIISILELEILPQLYRFITSEKKNEVGRKSEIRVSDLTAEKALGTAQSSSVNDTRAITQLPVAVAIAKIVRLFPEESFKTHIETLLHEIVLKLRTKLDKHRESARKVLCSVMREIGPEMLMFIVTKLKDMFVHGYQLHVLGYTIVTVLYTLYAPASPYALTSRKQAKLIAKSTNKKAVPASTTTVIGVDIADDDVGIDEDGNIPSELKPQFDEVTGKRVLHECTEVLFDIFMDDYLGAIGAQKDQIELMSTMPEVKKSRAVQGFIFLATHCDATSIMPKFLNKIAWVLAPPTAQELLKKSGAGGAYVVGSNSKYISGGDKKSVADLQFVNKVRFLSLRVARAFMTNRSLDLGGSLEMARSMIDRHNQVRDEKIARFEAKDGTRRIRGAWASQISASKKTTKERYEDNFTVAQRPERIDLDVNAATVLASASQQKQKLRVYRGRYAKELGEASKSFALEDMEAAIVLDTLDEFCLKFLLSVLKRVLGIGKEKKLGSIPIPSANENEEAVEDTTAVASDGDEEAEDEEDGEGEVTNEQVEEALENENEAIELVGDGTELDDLAVFAEEQDDTAAPKGTRRSKKSANSFASANKVLLDALVPVIVSSLEGEGSDTVVSHALDVLHALLVLRPPLDAVQTLGKSIFETIVQFFSRGGVIKQRALRVVGAVVQHKRFVLEHDDATRLVHLIRSEMIDKTEFLPNSLLLLHSVLSKHILIPEIYDVISVLTETMIHWSHSSTVRGRCVACLVKFVTEYKMTREKLRSHIDLYVRNLGVVSNTAQVALLELVDVLVSRFPAELLADEAQVIFVPVCGVLCRGEYREGKEKAASVIGHLAVNAGIGSISPVISEWLGSKSVSVRTSAYQALAVIIPELHASHSKYSDDAVSALFADLQFAIESLIDGSMTGEEEVLSKKERAKRNREAEDEEIAASKPTLTKQERTQADRRTWQPIFFALRAIEALIAPDPAFAFSTFGARLIERIFLTLLEHAHPWVRSTAYRIAVKYLYQCVEPRSKYLSTSMPQVQAPTSAETSTPAKGKKNKIAAAGLPLVCNLDSESDAVATFFDAEQQLARFSRYIKRVLATIVDHDVGNETYTVNRAVEEAVRGDTVKVALYLSKGIGQLCVALLRAKPQATHVLSHYSSIWSQLVGVAQPALEQRTIDGYTVRVTTLVQFMGGLITLLPTPSKDATPELLLLSRVTPSIMYRMIVPLVAASMDSKYNTVSTIGSKVCDAVRQELHKRAGAYSVIATQHLAPAPGSDEDTLVSSASGKKNKKARTESHDIPTHISVEDVVMQLTTKSNELRSIVKDEKFKTDARKALKRSRAQ
ncbi:Hypothetical protein, putative [Bodo saltans]|uniref:Uncharacterized protein n=1 Tax=Bodo saltans TaxID=75058 RepID=A0A0S4JCM2_BODSA|nr:Hypothetical protein, putative [Bodo saltans]|eukprot:CUG87949.1 Hypothetical protein, putative [Bodo saltans]